MCLPQCVGSPLKYLCSNSQLFSRIMMNLPLLCVRYNDFSLLPSVFLLWMDSRLMTLAQTLPHRSRYLNHLINAYGRLFLLLSLGFFFGSCSSISFGSQTLSDNFYLDPCYPVTTIFLRYLVSCITFRGEWTMNFVDCGLLRRL